MTKALKISIASFIATMGLLITLASLGSAQKADAAYLLPQSGVRSIVPYSNPNYSLPRYTGLPAYTAPVYPSNNLAGLIAVNSIFNNDSYNNGHQGLGELIVLDNLFNGSRGLGYSNYGYGTNSLAGLIILSDIFDDNGYGRNNNGLNGLGRLIVLDNLFRGGLYY